MARSRSIKGALNGFLGTFSSRNSDYHGYWLLGMLVRDVEQLTIDLLNPQSIPGAVTPTSAARELASTKFAEQIAKAGLAISSLQEASLDVAKGKGTVMGEVNGKISEGCNVRLRVRVLYKSGKEFESWKLMFVAPHNPQIELRSARAS